MKYLSIFLSLFLFSNCNTAKQVQENNPNAPFETILESEYGGNEEQRFFIIRSQDELKAELANMHVDEEKLNKLNTVDFKNKAVLSLHLGTRNTGGYGIKVSNVEINGNTTFVTIGQTSPKPGEMVTMALTQPFCLVVIDANENIVFDRQ